jgi:hypothetical protein
VGIRWLGGKSLHTTKSVAQMFLGVVFNVSSYLYEILLVAFFSMSAGMSYSVDH